MDNKIIEYSILAHKLINVNIRVKKNEQVLIVIDTNTDMRLALELASAVQIAGGEFTISMMPARPADNATNTTDIIAKSAEAADVIISLTRFNSCALFDSRVNRLIPMKKLRDITLSCRDPETFLRGGALADYEKILEDGLKLKEKWENKKTFRITSELGTDLVGEFGDYEIMLGCGIARNPGESMAFSDGEVSCTPKKNSVNGVIFVNGPIFGFRQPTVPIKLIIKDSRVVSVEDGDEDIVSGLKDMLKNIENMDYLAEVAIGLNPCSLRNGEFAEEKKAYGNLHIALGDNLYYGGDVSSKVHIDMVLKNANISMDNIDFVKNGDVIILK